MKLRGELEGSCSQENRPLDLDKSLYCHNTPMWDSLIIYPSKSHWEKSNMVHFSSLWSPTHEIHLSSSPPPPLLCRRISNSWLSTGWFTMTIALELCDRINVYGMVAPDFCRWDSGAACKTSSAHQQAPTLRVFKAELYIWLLQLYRNS